jgi:hypothetical protein
MKGHLLAPLPLLAPLEVPWPLCSSIIRLFLGKSLAKAFTIFYGLGRNAMRCVSEKTLWKGGNYLTQNQNLPFLFAQRTRIFVRIFIYSFNVSIEINY